MIKRILLAVSGLLIAGAGSFAASRRIGPLPPLGPLLDPAGGIWAVARAAEPLRNQTIAAPIFDQPVEVVVDERGVPHVYAATDVDAYRALGFMVARDRLFQLELQTRAGAGTLTELVGPAALESDRTARRLGFGRMVEQRIATIDTASRGYRAVAAYAQGVNAWIDRMRPADLPLEYRLLGARPARWAPANSYYLMARMALTLAENDASLLKARAAAQVGWPAAEALFPINSPIQEPIQPNAVDSTRVAFVPIPPPGQADSTVASVLTARGAFDLALRRLARWRADEALGSNNWAVGPRRSRSGHPLLAGDPHLELTLPSVWYQAHLVVPDRFDVAGVTLPGAPWVVIGFNRNLAWSLTNTGSDVNDFYEEVVDDSLRPTRYRLDGDWKPLAERIEVYRDPAGRTLTVDTVRFTHRGPLRRADSMWVSMAWTIYGADSSGVEFLGMGAARTAAEFLEASASYVAPAQNMLVADRRGTIAIRSTGRYPVRPYSGRGDLIRDGTSSAADWTGALPVEFYPFALNPARGFLSSANQQPVDPEVNPRFLGANWYSPWRAIRINQLLRADSAVTVDAMRRFQTDPGSARADAFLPTLLGQGLDSARLAATPARAREARGLLAEWDRTYTVANTRSVLFEAVMVELGRRTWDELRADRAADGADEWASPRPAEAILAGLLRDSTNVWWDDRSTAGAETRDEIVAAALAAGLDSTIARHGPPGQGWRWGDVHHANINHPLGIAALSARKLSVPSGPATLSPSSGSGTSGASWRMVVELGPTVQAWGTYPGGQSGNPASPHYRDLLPRWLAGDLDSLIVPPVPEQFPSDRVEARIRFVKGR